MSAKKLNSIVVAVTGGDAIATNRLSGKSNTGTYFISSKKNWREFSQFFNESGETVYTLDLNRIKAYKATFIEMFFNKKDQYKDKMKNFENICDSLLLYCENPIIKFELRINDSRIFLKFVDNNKEVEYALRGIIYSNLTNLIFVKENAIFYLEVNFDVDSKNSNNKDEFYDEFD